MSEKPIDADCAGKLTILPGERVDELQQAGLRILQKEQGFRFGMDAVLLSSFVRAESRDRCADFGTGTGILPLLLAGLHLAFAFPFVHKLLLLFNLWNTRLLVGTTAASFLAFAALYTLVYRITSNAYYHIVSGGGER